MSRRTADILCPVCHSRDTYVVDTRGTDDQTRIDRRRICAQCETARRTTELPTEPMTDAEAEAIRQFAEQALTRYAQRQKPDAA